MDYKLELLAVPVTDVDRAKQFYVEQAGFVADHDQRVSETLRFVQLTPPGSGCSIAFGDGISDMAPGSLSGLQLVVDDIEAAQREYTERGLDAGAIDVQPWGRFLYFADPDGNRWSVQEVTRAAVSG